ncbi:MAG: PilX N-terminal domain-containing pilus assembly protein [Gammaproteobacteria bacterium]|nr:PilX N-terminal domain-containing pilus assembly protein [Gammaproteobacteria bacterium]
MIKEKGAATLLIAAILMVSATLIVLYAGQHSMLQQKSVSSQNNHNQSFEAAEAGLEFAIAYLNQNATTILASPSGGFISYGASNSALTNVSLSNNSKFSVVYTNPIANNYALILITVTGKSVDSSSTKIVQQQVAQQPNIIMSTVSSLGNISFVGGATLLNNTVTGSNISTGGTVTINNGAQTFTASGVSSYQGHFGSDVQQNVAAYQGLSESAYFQALFGVSETAEKSAVQSSGLYYSNLAADYSQKLSGVTGKNIWIDQSNGSTVTIGQGVTIGSSANPVTLIVMGDLSIANGAIIYGFVYASGPSNGFSLAGGAKIYGGIASGSTMNISNGFQMVYNKFPRIVGASGAGAYARVPGTWRDF